MLLDRPVVRDVVVVRVEAASFASGSWGCVQQLATIANGSLMPLKPVQISGPITTSEWLSGPRKTSCTTPRVGEPVAVVVEHELDRGRRCRRS